MTANALKKRIPEAAVLPWTQEPRNPTVPTACGRRFAAATKKNTVVDCIYLTYREKEKG